MSQYRERYDNESIVCPFCGEDEEPKDASYYDDGNENEYTCKPCGAKFVATARVSVRFDSMGLREWLEEKVASYTRGLERLEKEDTPRESALKCTRESRDRYQARLDGFRGNGE
jgi:transposase-like protein